MGQGWSLLNTEDTLTSPRTDKGLLWRREESNCSPTKPKLFPVRWDQTSEIKLVKDKQSFHIKGLFLSPNYDWGVRHGLQQPTCETSGMV